MPQFKVTAQLGEFLEERFSQSFQVSRQYRPAAGFLTMSSVA
jgi:hypothetical protein